MRTKSSPTKPAAKAQAKQAQAPASSKKDKKKANVAGSKLATLVSVKETVKNAIFGSSRPAAKAKQLEKPSSSKTPMKASPSKAKSASLSKTPPPAAKSSAASKAASAKAAASAAKGGKGAAQPAKNGKAGAPTPAAQTSGKGAKGKAIDVAPTAPAAKGRGAKATPVSPLLKAATTGKKTNARLHPDDVCRETACESLSTTLGYCRLHYIKNWKKIKRKEVILKEGKLNQYIEELVAKYPDKYIEAIRQDLASDKDFAAVITDLDLDESVDDFESEGESAEGLIENIKGGGFDDEGDGF